MSSGLNYNRRSPVKDGSYRTRLGKAPTEKQLDYIKALAARAGVEVPFVGTMDGASRHIERLKKLPKAPPAEDGLEVLVEF